MSKDLPVIRKPEGPDVHEGDVERMSRFQPLNPGHYWRAKKDVKEKGARYVEVAAGCVLLLQRIKRVDDVPHAVELAGHPLINPNSTHTFLVHDFLNKFEPEPRGAEIRAEEMAKVQAQITEQQRDLLNFQTNPAALLTEIRKNPALPKPEDRRGREDKQLPVAPFDFEAGLPSADFQPNSSIVELAGGDAQLMQRQANNQAIVARKRAEMIKSKTEAIAETVKQLTPFFEEMGAVALAQSADALDMYKKLQSGLATLGLYTGTDVTVTEVRTGESAPAEEVIHIFQALMYMDEESIIHVGEGGENISDLGRFKAQLAKDDALLERLIPVPRGIVAVRYKHERRDHPEGIDAFTAARIDDEDMKCFLVIRNGERVNLVHSSLEKMDRMFPTQLDFDKPFTGGGFWRGIESERITVEDVQFSDARAKLDNLILHYRRVLILLAGLYDRERHVIGDIPALAGNLGLGLLSLSVQEQVFRAVSDEERALGMNRPDFYDWLKQKNALAQSGSRLLCNWNHLMTADSAPSAVTRGDKYDRVRYEPKEPFALAIAHRVKQTIEVQCPVKGYSHSTHSDREFNAAVNVTLWERSDATRGDFGYLCLDDVSPEEVSYYIYTRHNRRGYIKYVPMLMAARRQLEFDAKREELLRADLRKTGASNEAISTVIRHWRAARRGAEAPSPASDAYADNLKAMRSQLSILAGEGAARRKAAEEICEKAGTLPLRLSLSGRSKFYLYTTVVPGSRENLLGEHPWVLRLAMIQKPKDPSNFDVLDTRYVILPKQDAKEEVLAEWDGVKDWVEPKRAHRLSYDQARALRDLGTDTLERASWFKEQGEDMFRARLKLVKEETDERSKRFVGHGNLFLPLCIVDLSINERHWRGLTDGGYDKTTRHKFYVAGITVHAVDALYTAGTADQKKQIREWFKSLYRRPASAIEGLGAAPVLTYISVDRFVDGKNKLIGDAPGHYVEAPKKKRDAGVDEKAILKSIIDREARTEGSTAEVVLRFDAAAVEVYQSLRSK